MSYPLARLICFCKAQITLRLSCSIKLLLANKQIKSTLLIQMDTSGLGNEQCSGEFELVSSLGFGFWPLSGHCQSRTQQPGPQTAQLHNKPSWVPCPWIEFFSEHTGIQMSFQKGKVSDQYFVVFNSSHLEQSIEVIQYLFLSLFSRVKLH